MRKQEEKFEYAVITVTTDDRVQIIGHHDKHLTLDDLYRYVNCDTIQIVRTETYPKDLDLCLCIDDNGKLLHKPINLLGTVLYGQFPTDFIVGDVCIGTTWTGDPYDEPDMYCMRYEQAEDLAKFLRSLKRLR